MTSPMSRNSSSASMAAASVQRQAAMSGEPQSTTAPSALTGMRAKPRASSATPPQRSVGWSSATGSLPGGGSGAGSLGSVSHALHGRHTDHAPSMHGAHIFYLQTAEHSSPRNWAWLPCQSSRTRR